MVRRACRHAPWCGVLFSLTVVLAMGSAAAGVPLHGRACATGVSGVCNPPTTWKRALRGTPPRPRSGLGQPTVVSGGPGSEVPVAGWTIQSSRAVQAGGAQVSQPGFPTTGWYPVAARSTVLAGLVENHRYPDIFFSTNMRDAIAQRSPADFQVPWWYRADVVLTRAAPLHTFLRLNGIISRADVWLNGRLVATHDQVVGAFNAEEYDVTGLIHRGRNALAILVYPTDPQQDLSIYWIDWNPAPPDNNMGIWRDVDFLQSGPVALRSPRVLTTVALPRLDRADLVVKVDARNDDDRPRRAVIAGAIGAISFRQAIILGPHETRTVTFAPPAYPQLALHHPHIWWPAQMGAQPLYELALTARVGTAVSDRARLTFGIRDVRSYLTRQGYRQFVINGRPLLIRGAGWASDIFLRYQPTKLEDEFRYVRDLGLNAIRSEGKLETDEFYTLADRYGIMALPGWACCDKWQWQTASQPWTDEDYRVAGQSMASEAQLLRNHPSVIAFLIGSDYAPPPRIEKIYARALRANDWPDPIISAASERGAPPITGQSGMKMRGPYDWVPPSYWYEDTQLGGAFGFNSETSAGNDIPTLDSLKKMLSPAELAALWQNPDAVQYHASPPGSPFAALKIFDVALAQRYGPPRSLADYVEKAQLMNYEATRAQFEAYSRNMGAPNRSTGVIYWMLNNAWPSLHWHLFDAYLEPAGAYFGAKKANEGLHIQYSYDDRSIVVVNQTPRAARGLMATARVYNLDGTSKLSQHESAVVAPANHAERLFAIPQLSGLSRTYFVELTLADWAGHTLSRNVYWLSTQPDVLAWNSATWYYTPTTRYADFSELQRLKPASVALVSRSTASGGQGMTSVRLTNASTTRSVAFFMTLTLRRGAGGDEVLPVTWSDNDVSLWPGESLTLVAHYRLADLHGTAPTVELSGWNVRHREVTAWGRLRLRSHGKPRALRCPGDRHP